jgi:hypothetical protein
VTASGPALRQSRPSPAAAWRAAESRRRNVTNAHLTPTKLVQKISAGEIAMPLVRIESSQKSAKGVHLADLAEYLDARAEAARKEMIALTS